MTIAELLSRSVQRLTATSQSPELDSEVLLAHVLDKPRSYLKTWPERGVDLAAQRAFFQLLDSRAQKKPVAYLVGQQEFWSLAFNVSPDVLIPRPDTEMLVDYLLQKGRVTQCPASRQVSVLDLGTGSGAIAVAIQHEQQHWQVVATDISDHALAIARENAKRHCGDSIQFYQGAWFEALPARSHQTFDFIVSNPPYVEADAPELVQSEISHEPMSALVADNNGLADIETLVTQAAQYLSDDGVLVIEHGHQQGDAVRQLFAQQQFVDIETVKDLAGLERFTSGGKPAHG